MPEVGVILTDLSLNPIALNREAIDILRYTEGLDVRRRIMSGIPQGLLDVIRQHKSTDVLSLVTTFRSGGREYICRAYFMDANNVCVAQPILALLLEPTYADYDQDDINSEVAANPTARDQQPVVNLNDDTISQVATRFNLTERERNVFKGISLGLTSKEIAQRMNISPNTVKAFLRLIMGKMRVTTRTAVIAKLLEHNGDTPDRDGHS